MGSTAKRPAWLHAAIEHRRDPFTSSYCFVFKDRTTHNAAEARAWSTACFRIDEERRIALEKKRVRRRHVASFRARQRAQYADDSIMVNDGSGEWHTTANLGRTMFDGDVSSNSSSMAMDSNDELARQELQMLRQRQRRRQLQEVYSIRSQSSSLQYMPATRTGTPIGSRIPGREVRQDVQNMLNIVRARPRAAEQSGQPLDARMAMPGERPAGVGDGERQAVFQGTTTTTAAAAAVAVDQKQQGTSDGGARTVSGGTDSVSTTPGKAQAPDDDGAELRFSDLKKRQQQQEAAVNESADPRMDEVLAQLADARQRLAAMEHNDSSVNDTSAASADVSAAGAAGGDGNPAAQAQLNEITGQLEQQKIAVRQLSTELQETSAALDAANNRIEAEVKLRSQLEQAQKSILLQKDGASSSSSAPPSSDSVSMVPLDQVVEEREGRKAQFAAMLGQLEKKRSQEKAQRKVAEERLRAEMAEMAKQLDEERGRSAAQIAELTTRVEQLQAKRDREFQGRETA
jgi:hypothetical protein